METILWIELIERKVEINQTKIILDVPGFYPDDDELSFSELFSLDEPF